MQKSIDLLYYMQLNVESFMLEDKLFKCDCYTKSKTLTNLLKSVLTVVAQKLIVNLGSLNMCENKVCENCKVV